MTIDEMHTALRLELDKSDSLNSISFEPEEMDYWINKAIKRFVKTRYTGSNYKGQGFEESQKRIDDLKAVVSFTSLEVTPNEGIENRILNSFSTQLPEDYWFSVAEECEIIFNPYSQNLLTPVESGDLVEGSYYLVVGASSITHNAVSYSPGEYFSAENEAYTVDGEDPDTYVVLLDKVITGITQADSDTYRRYIDDPYSEHKLYYYSAKPLRLFRSEDEEPVVILISDGTYYITRYFLTYIREPDTVSIFDGDDCNLSEHAHDEIVDIAATMMIENIESQRIQSQPGVSINE